MSLALTLFFDATTRFLLPLPLHRAREPYVSPLAHA